MYDVSPHVYYIYAWATGDLSRSLELYDREGIAGFKRLFPFSMKCRFVTLWRGVNRGEANGGYPVTFDGVSVQHLTSWTLDYEVARRWGKFVIKQEVSADDIAFFVGNITNHPSEREVVVVDYHQRPWTVCPAGRPYEEERWRMSF